MKPKLRRLSGYREVFAGLTRRGQDRAACKEFDIGKYRYLPITSLLSYLSLHYFASSTIYTVMKSWFNLLVPAVACQRESDGDI